MRWLVTLAVAAAACLAISLGTQTASASCVAAVTWHGVTYVGERLHPLPKRSGELSGGVRPACNDTPNAEPEPDSPVSLQRFEHVPARIAVATADDVDTAYLAPGFLLELASHPLHKYVRPATAAAPFRCAAPAVLRGHTRWQPGPGTRFTVFTAGGREVDVRVRASTRVRARRVAGMPYLGTRERLVVSGCRSKNGKVIGANSVRRLAPRRRPASDCQKLSKRYDDLATGRDLVVVQRGKKSKRLSACVLPRGKVRALAPANEGGLVDAAGTWVLVEETFSDPDYGGVGRWLYRIEVRHNRRVMLSGYSCHFSEVPCMNGTDYDEAEIARTGAGAFELISPGVPAFKTTLQSFNAAGALVKLADGAVDDLLVTSLQISWTQAGAFHAAPLP